MLFVLWTECIYCLWQNFQSRYCFHYSCKNNALIQLMASIWFNEFIEQWRHMASVILVYIGSGNGFSAVLRHAFHEPVQTYCQLDPQKQTSVKFESKIFFLARKSIKDTKWRLFCKGLNVHNSNVIMCAMGSQNTSVSIVNSIVSSGADQRKHQSSLIKCS